MERSGRVNKQCPGICRVKTYWVIGPVSRSGDSVACFCDSATAGHPRESAESLVLKCNYGPWEEGEHTGDDDERYFKDGDDWESGEQPN